MKTIISTETPGWQIDSLELANQGSRFGIDGVITFQEIAFCNALAKTHGYHVSVHRGLASFTRLATDAYDQWHPNPLADFSIRNRSIP